MAGQQPCGQRSVPFRSQSPPEQPLQVKVVGLFKSSSFQVAKSTAEVTAKKLQVREALPTSQAHASSWRRSRLREGRVPAEPGWSGGI